MENLLDWFESIKQKHLFKFLPFDIEKFYPSIKEALLKKALDFVEAYITVISTDDKSIINHARKSSLFSNKEAWVKRESGLFHILIGSYDGAEVCKLVSNFLLQELPEKYKKKHIGLYRDEGLMFSKTKLDPNLKKSRKASKLYSVNTSKKLPSIAI